MWLSDISVRRPLVAVVLSALLTVFGLVAFSKLTVREMPDVQIPSVSITTTYEGAAPSVMESQVTKPIEDQLSGISGIKNINSMTRKGRSMITVEFKLGWNMVEGISDVRDALSRARPRLPDDVDEPLVTKDSGNGDVAIWLNFSSSQMDRTAMTDYANRVLVDPLSLVDGVSEVALSGDLTQVMYVRLRPADMAARGITVSDVEDALKRENIELPGGEIRNNSMTMAVQIARLYHTAEDFQQLQVTTAANGQSVYLADIADVEVGAKNEDSAYQRNGKESLGIGIVAQSTANPLAVAQGIEKKLGEMQRFLPEGAKLEVDYDSTIFIKQAIDEVYETLAICAVLVVAVLYLFLGQGRTTLIPAITVPVSLISAFIGAWYFGFSINLITLLALILAIGLVVDDAIVVVENVERIMSEEGLTPREATRKSMGQIQGALVGIAMVLSAVFVPMAFFGGTTGAIYRQFSITIVAAMVLSVLVAMILTPALCATLLKPLKKGEHHGQKGFFAWFNQMFNRNAERYEKGVAKILHRSLRWIVIYVLLLGGMVFLFLRLPTSFLPLEDRGMFTTSVQLPSGSTQQQTLKVVEQIEKYYFTHEKDNIMSVFATVGSGPGGNGQNVARMFIRLKDWSERDSKTGTSFAIIERATKAFNQIKEARVIASSPPAISGLGSSAGFDMELQDHAGAGHDALMAARNQLLALAAENPELTRVRHNGLDDSPQLQIDIDQRKAQALGVAIDDINDTLQTAWGSSYVNDFMDRGRVKKVYVQAAAPYRMLPDDINLWYVRNKDGGMVPFSAFATSRWETGSPRLERYNGYSAVEIVGEAAPGVSTGTAMDIMESLVKQLPNGFGLEWTAMSYQERLSGAQAPALYAISLLVVFLCLAALYESWSVPFSVMLVVPLGVIGALLATWMRGLENDVYFQVGLLTVIGLSAKNAILIVEFANEMNQKGHDLFEATLHACRQRLRPILMTSLAFIFGVLPMATSTGAGSGGQHAVGTGVMGGMISATILAIYFVPLFFVLVRRRFPLKPRPE